MMEHLRFQNYCCSCPYTQKNIDRQVLETFVALEYIMVLNLQVIETAHFSKVRHRASQLVVRKKPGNK